MTHMYERGQVVVPQYFREILGWGKDTAVSFRVENNRLIVERRTSIADELEEFARECNINLKGKQILIQLLASSGWSRSFFCAAPEGQTP